MRRRSLAAAFAASLAFAFAAAPQAAASETECATSYARLVTLAQRTGQAQDYLAAADCAASLKRSDDAIAYYKRALAGRLERDERHEALKALAYQLEARERWAEAADVWDEALAVKVDEEGRLGAARMAVQVGNTARASQWLSVVDPSRLTTPVKAEYWSLKAQVLKETNPEAALAALNTAIALEDAAYRRAERADILTKLDRRKEAIADLEAAHLAEPSNVSTALSLAYALSEAGRYGEAAAMFERASRTDPKATDYLEDWGYALLGAGRTDEAKEKFKTFVDLKTARQTPDQSEQDEQVWNARRQIYDIERSFYASAFATYRSDAGLPSSLLTNNSSLQNAFGAEVGWRASRDVTVFGSAYFAYDDQMTLNRDSAQGSVGLRWQPLPDHELFLSVERLIKLGDGSREGWLTGISFSASEGGEWNPTSSQWFFASIAAYANYLLDEPHFFSAAVEGKFGETFALSYLWTLTPHLVIFGEMRDDSGTTSSLIEGGGGLSLQRWFCDDHYAGPLCSADLTVQYRYPIATEGFLKGDGSVVASISVGL